NVVGPGRPENCHNFVRLPSPNFNGNYQWHICMGGSFFCCFILYSGKQLTSRCFPAVPIFERREIPRPCPACWLFFRCKNSPVAAGDCRRSAFAVLLLAVTQALNYGISAT